jgi:SAM-dependent methyltransferase
MLNFEEGFDGTLSAVNQIWERYKAESVSADCHPDDDMTHPEWDHDGTGYLATGQAALKIILQSLVAAEKKTVNTILDMPCGFGRVTRHIKAAFPEAKVYACDLYDDRINYCADQFGAVPFKSREVLSDIELPGKFDLIWCGSLLTHLPKPIFLDALRFYSASLAEDGIAIITLLGRVSPYIHHNRFKYLADEAFSRVERDFNLTGFGYADYNLPTKFFEQSSYGIAVVSPSYVIRCIESDNTIRICGYLERHWVAQQDVLILKKTALNQR